MLLAIALALLVAQALSALLLYRAIEERREAALVGSAAFRLAAAPRERAPEPFAEGRHGSGRLRVKVLPVSPLRPGEQRNARAERALAEALGREGVAFGEVVIVERPIASDPAAQRWAARHHRRRAHGGTEPPRSLMIAAIHRPDGRWLHARVPVPGAEPRLLRSLVTQALLIYAVLVGAVAFLLRRITQPLAALTRRMERFAETRDSAGQLPPAGPDDVRRLMIAHNAMEARIAALLDEKDVMLGAIGHDLKTPLAALRVRIESVEDDIERGRMAAVIEDINRSLDDILTLARVGRPSDPLEPTELAALAGAVVEEYEDMGEPVTIVASERLVSPARATWLRRALRNLIDNALRYGGCARLSLAREGSSAVLRIEDDGPGIAESEVGRMLEPFTRIERSRNTATGGAGLGLTLARAIAEQHGGTLELANRRDGAGLIAALRLPLS